MSSQSCSVRLYCRMGADICEKQKQHHWGSGFIKRLSVDLRTEFPHTEGFSYVNLYYLRRWYFFYSSNPELFHQAGEIIQDEFNVVIRYLHHI